MMVLRRSRRTATDTLGGSRAGADFDALFRSYVGDVYRYAVSLLGDRASAEDVTALAFERLYRARSRIDIRRGTPRGLLFTIARNAALDELRRRRRRGTAGEATEHVVDERSGAALEEVERRAMIAAALAALAPRDRELVLLKFHGQLSNAELARALGISESNAATRLHRALTALREATTATDWGRVA